MDVGSVENPQDVGYWELCKGETLNFSKKWYDNETTIVFGRHPDTQSPKYSRFENEVGVTLLDDSGEKLSPLTSRRAFAMTLQPDGGINLINTGSKDLRWSQKGSKIEIIQPNRSVSLDPKRDDYRNLKITIEPGYRIEAQSVGSTGNANVMGLLSVKFS